MSKFHITSQHIFTHRHFYALFSGLCILLAGLLLTIYFTRPGIAQTTHRSDSQPQQSVEAPFTFPGGGRVLVPDYRFVALYGSPGAPVLGVLGEQDVAATMQRAKDTAAQYAHLSDKPIYPTIELITTIASASPTENSDYSRELDMEQLRPWINAAKHAGVYVVLDLQPGRTDFLTQAKQYEQLLREPHVGLALDPEWRLAPDQVHMKQIGRVSIEEVNSVGAWLASLTQTNKLPQKLFVLHQFRISMIQNREQLDTSRDELAYIIHIDGQGSQPQKNTTWRALTASPPENVTWGWKNFIDEDKPMLNPEQTMQVSPAPTLITYQ